MNKIGTIEDKNILFLQGPMGDFFKQLDNIFQKKGAKTYRIGFNMGDRFFSNAENYTPYRDKREDYKEFIEAYLKKHNINKIFLFGDCRFYQSISIKIAVKLHIDVFVFEEGYIRPNYITMEKHGVNDYSHVSRDSNFYTSVEAQTLKASDVEYKQFKMVKSAAVYYLISNIFDRFFYPNYEHHRDFSAMKEFFYSIRSVYRKGFYRLKERNCLNLVKGKLSKKYFFVPLQTYNDFQILQHSGYKSVEKFIIEVIESFSLLCSNEHLIFKHHPVDRGRKDYTDFIMEQAEYYDVRERVIVLYDTYLPVLLQNAKGTITINSTVGLSSINHGTPTITLGNAIYDIEGLTCKNMKLNDFWSKQVKPDMDLLAKYRTFIIKNTQLNGSFYGKLPSFDELIDGDKK